MAAALLLMALILGPLTLMLIWAIIGELRGVPAFQGNTPSDPDRLDAFGRWALSCLCLVVGGFAYLKGGLVGVVTIASAIAVLTTVIALVWTIAQSLRHALKQRRSIQLGDSPAYPFVPIRRRFAINFRRTIIEVPAFFTSFW
jgi:hypothetical protein